MRPSFELIHHIIAIDHAKKIKIRIKTINMRDNAPVMNEMKVIKIISNSGQNKTRIASIIEAKARKPQEDAPENRVLESAFLPSNIFLSPTTMPVLKSTSKIQIINASKKTSNRRLSDCAKNPRSSFNIS